MPDQLSQNAVSPPPLRDVVRPTTFIEAPRLADRFHIDLHLASETFQHTGSFKFRAAYHLAANVPHLRFITASSGNFGQALAKACQMLGKHCLVVMPMASARVKVAAVREYGGTVHLIDTRVTSRQASVAALAQADPGAYVASPYDDPLVIAGNATLGVELAASGRQFDMVLAPVGGGGLASGLVEGLRKSNHPAQVFGVEPELGNDLARSFKIGRLLANETEPKTMADGVRTLSVGQNNWRILQHGLAGIVEVSEEQIADAVDRLFSLANLKAEPTGALSIAALLAEPARFQGRSVCCVVSGGNVDPGEFCRILARKSDPAASGD